jgi:murein L,D-transpeptidase YcbB/YkuD
MSSFADVVRRVLLMGAALAGCGSPPGPEARQAGIPAPDGLVAERIRARIEADGAVAALRAGGEPIYESAVLPGFYEGRLYHPAWSDERGPAPVIHDLVNALRQADREGLRPDDYHLAAIDTLLAAVRADVRSGGLIVPDRWAELDLLLTDAFLVYGSHLLAGRVNHEVLQPEWVANRRAADFAGVLAAVLRSGDVAATLERLSPAQRGFRRLREALVYHRAVVARGGWPAIPDGRTLKLGDHGAPVAVLRERLRLGGDLGSAQAGEDPERFEEGLERAVKRFQRRHGLRVDGAMGAATRAELNVSAERRVEQVELNLERWRWLPKDLGRRHIVVNIAAFALDVVEEETVVLSMRVVVGLPYRRTPVFSNTMRYLVLHPAWHVPRSLAVQDLLPRIQRDSSYLAGHKVRVFQGWGPGRIKFMFLNRFNIYLHDTPARPLFDEAERDFSSGCIRVERAVELAAYLLHRDPRWSRAALLRALDGAVDGTVPLPEPIPIHLLYWTAWADWDGTIQFRRDIYDRDAPLRRALRAPLSTGE